MVVEELSDLQAVSRFGPIAEHYRNRRKHLNVDACCVHFIYPPGRFPTILFYISKLFSVVTDHMRGARLVMVQRYKTAVAKTIFPVRYVLRKYVRVAVDLEHHDHSN